MSTIATSERLITLYYSSNSRRAKLTLAYAKSEGLPVQEIDILKTPLTGMQLVALAERLGIKVKDLVNQNHPAFKAKFKAKLKGHDFELSSDDWIKMIRHNPEIMKQPIALRGDITILVETPSDIIKI
jgi:arsenate reductase